MLATLLDLPVELLHEIQLYALWPEFPQTSKHFYQVYDSAPISWQAEYILGRVESLASAQALTVALRYPKCSAPVFDAILSRVEPQDKPQLELPRRLFKSLSERPSFSNDDDPLPFLRYLHTKASERNFTLQVDAYDGYALKKAVQIGFTPLIKLLLEKGASPTCGDGLSLMIAIRRKDLALVKMLVEREAKSLAHNLSSNSSGLISEPQGSVEQRKRKRRPADEGTRPAKRPRLPDRLQPTPVMVKMAVRCQAREIVQYFVREKGCIPDIETLAMLR